MANFQYDPKKVAGSWAPAGLTLLVLNEGIADGTFFRVTPDGDAWLADRGGDGEETRIRLYNDGGVFEATYKQAAAIHKPLWIAHETDKNAGGKAVGPLTLKDPSGGTLIVAAQAYLIGRPPIERASNAGVNVTWRWRMPSFHGVLAGHEALGG